MTLTLTRASFGPPNPMNKTLVIAVASALSLLLLSLSGCAGMAAMAAGEVAKGAVKGISKKTVPSATISYEDDQFHYGLENATRYEYNPGSHTYPGYSGN